MVARVLIPSAPHSSTRELSHRKLPAAMFAPLVFAGTHVLSELTSSPFHRDLDFLRYHLPL